MTAELLRLGNAKNARQPPRTFGNDSSIAKRMADNVISLESIVQRTPETGDKAAAKNVILVTHETTEAAVRKALEAIEKDGILMDRAQMIRIERAG